jgi:hypothetical protein
MKPGWNMVTLPELTNDRINSTWTDLLGGVTPVKVVAWSAQNSKYFNLADPVTYNQALWYKMNSDLSIPYESYHQMVDIPILLYGKYQNGWNLVGNPFPIPVYWDVDRIHVLSGNQTLTLREAKAQGLVKDYGWTWDGSKYRFVCDPEIYSVSNYTQVIPPFGGIWIKSTADCQIVFNSN